ncbi:MAG: hypothetical protein K6T65_15625 [Peptococcaceae bacterium]|nr:hypothetical protein [Peptococcaceae bacterium]
METSFRYNLVTLSHELCFEEKTMVDYSAGEISAVEVSELIKELAVQFNSEYNS